MACRATRKRRSAWSSNTKSIAANTVRSADQMEDQFTGGWPLLRVVLEDALQKLMRTAILKEWPDDFPKPNAAQLWR